MSIRILPLATLVRILVYLRVCDLETISHVNREYYALLQSDNLWWGLICERFHYVPSGSPQMSPRAMFLKYDGGMRVPAVFSGAGTTEPQYWLINKPASDSVYGKVSYVRNIWWLEGAMCIPKVPPGRYGVLWRIAPASNWKVTMFHTTVPLKAARNMGLTSTLDLLKRRGGDTWVQSAAGGPTKDEKVETPRYTYTFAPQKDLTSWKIGEKWWILVFPSTLVVTDISDVYCGVYDVLGTYHTSFEFDWIQLLPLKRDDPATVHTQAFAQIMTELADQEVRLCGAGSEVYTAVDDM